VYCSVCGQEIFDSEQSCSKCGFDEIYKEITDKDDHIKWLRETVVPYGINYILSTMSPSELKRIKLLLGLEDGIIHSDEEVALMENVRITRIQQQKAKFIRRLIYLPCQIKLQELLNNVNTPEPQ